MGQFVNLGFVSSLHYGFCDFFFSLLYESRYSSVARCEFYSSFYKIAHFVSSVIFGNICVMGAVSMNFGSALFESCNIRWRGL